jgi:hypothetical protein
MVGRDSPRVPGEGPRTVPSPPPENPRPTLPTERTDAVRAARSGRPAPPLKSIPPMVAPRRGWESPAAGHRFELDRAYVAEPEPRADFILEFFDEAGAPMPMEVGDVVVTRVVRHPLRPGRSRIFLTTGAVSDSGLDVGYACVTSNYPLEFAAVYRVLDPSGAPVSEAGIEGA